MTAPGATGRADEEQMARALALGRAVRATTSPNPWVGCLLVPALGNRVFEGATRPPGGPHAEAVALAAAGQDARGSTAYVTLEPCSHHGRTPPCADALIAAGVRRVVVGVTDPDARVSGRGVQRLRDAGVEVTVGVCADQVAEVLAPYLKHRRTGRPWVVLKLAASLDGRIAAPGGQSKWITGPEARADTHRLRAESDAVLIGAGTVRADDPSLTVRDAEGRDPLRVVLGSLPADARVRPAMTMEGDLEAVLDDLGSRGILQLLVEGGARVAHAFHRARLVDRYVVYLSPTLFGGDDAVPMFAGPAAPSMTELWRGEFRSVEHIGADLRIELQLGQHPMPLGPT